MGDTPTPPETVPRRLEAVFESADAERADAPVSTRPRLAVASHRHDDDSSGSTDSPPSTSFSGSRRPQRRKKWRGGPPPTAPRWEEHWTYDHCARYIQTFDLWERDMEGWVYRIGKYLPGKEAALMLMDNIKSRDAKRVFQRLPMSDIMQRDGVQLILRTMKAEFSQKKGLNIAEAMISMSWCTARHIRASAPTPRASETLKCACVMPSCSPTSERPKH